MGGAALGFAALPGYVVSGTVLGSTSTTNYSLYNLIFGCDVTPDEKMVAGLLIAFILLVAGVVIDLLIVALSVEGKKKEQASGHFGLSRRCLLNRWRRHVLLY